MIGAALDRFIGVFSPMRGLRRVQARQAMSLMSAYRAAERNRTNADWRTKSRSADASVIPDQPLMLQRSRDMVLNNPNIASIHKGFIRHVVGKGFTHQSAAVDMQGKPVPEFNRLAGEKFWQWSTNPHKCDTERRRTLSMFTRWAASELVQAGGGLIVMSHTKDFRLVLQAVEYEQLDRYKIEDANTKNEIRGGVEVDEYGAAVAYHIYTHHPYDHAGIKRNAPLSLESVRISADRVIHVYSPDRARQTLGAPLIAPVVEKARDLAEYEYAQLLAARAEACIGLVIKSNPATSALGLNTPTGQTATDRDQNNYFRMQPLMSTRLAPGEEIQSHTPTRPGNMYDPFTKNHKREIAAGSGLSYDLLARNPDGSYSAARQNLVEDHREFTVWQDLIVLQMLQPIYREWVFLEVMSGRLSTKGYGLTTETMAYADWLPHGEDWVDPKNEAEAESLLIEKGLATETEVLAKHGKDFREVQRQRAFEQKFKQQLAAEVAAETAPAPTPIAQPQPQPAQQPETAGVAA